MAASTVFGVNERPDSPTAIAMVLAGGAGNVSVDEADDVSVDTVVENFRDVVVLVDKSSDNGVEADPDANTIVVCTVVEAA